jgi:hypothetical protein
MPYALKLYIYLFVWFTTAAVLAARWLHDFSASIILTFSAVYAVLMILFGRWLFGRKAL